METFSPKDKVVDIIKEYPTTRILFDEVSHFDDTASVEDFCFKNSIDIFSFWNKLSKEMRIRGHIGIFSVKKQNICLNVEMFLFLFYHHFKSTLFCY